MIVLMELVQYIIQWIQIHSIQYITSQEEIGSEMEYDFGKTKEKLCAVINFE